MNKNTHSTHASTCSTTPPPAGRFTRRIGNTHYEVSVHFSKTSTETIDDKILRLIRNEVASGKAVGL